MIIPERQPASQVFAPLTVHRPLSRITDRRTGARTTISAQSDGRFGYVVTCDEPSFAEAGSSASVDGALAAAAEAISSRAHSANQSSSDPTADARTSR